MRVAPLAIATVLAVACAPPLAQDPPPAETAHASPRTDGAGRSASPAGAAGPVPSGTVRSSPTPVEPTATPRPGLLAFQSADDLAITIFGLMPDERVEVSVRLSTRGFTIPTAADGSGETRLSVPLRGDAPLEVLVRRTSGEELRKAFGRSPGATAPVVAASIAPSSVAPSTAAPSATLAPRVPFAVALEPADPPPGSTPEIVVTGLLAGEAFELEVGVTGGGMDTYGAQADAAGSFRWRAPVVPGLGFRVTAVRRSGERAGTALAAVATSTPATTEPPCVTTGPADASTGVEGHVTWAGRPLGDLTVEVRQTPAHFVYEWCLDCRLFGSGVTDAAGRFRVTGIPPGVRVEVAIPDTRYTGYGPDGRTVRRADTCAGRILPLYSRDEPLPLYWNVKGFETSAREADGAVTLRWDPAPGATSYCLRMLDQGPPPFTIGAAITTGPCMGLADHAMLTNPTFRTPPLVAGDRKYDVRIVAFTGTSASGVFFGGFRKFE